MHTFVTAQWLWVEEIMSERGEMRGKLESESEHPNAVGPMLSKTIPVPTNCIISSPPGQNGGRIAEDDFKCNFVNKS